MKQKFYSLKRIEKMKAQYNIIIGEKANGKTYSLLRKIINDYVNTGKKAVIIKRWKEDLDNRHGNLMFSNMIKHVKILTNGKWDSICYYKKAWYFCYYNGQNKVMDDTPFAYGVCLQSGEHVMITFDPNVKIIVFDDFITHNSYLPQEFDLFSKTIFEITQNNIDVNIYMLGNPINKYCPYFEEMKLEHLQKMKPGEIDLYVHEEYNFKVAVEYCPSLFRRKL